MALVQVSRITNRKGLTENLPQLAGAELGYAIDSRRLFIGNGTLAEGAPVIGNTEILTEFSDITVLSGYTYEDIAVGYAAQTGATPSDPVVRTVQAKLDDFADVRDFGAVGNGLADDTEAINRALFQLYCRENNTQIRRTLYFPAGTYKITESIIIPTFAKLQGEGADCSIIELDTSGDISSLSAFVARFGDSRQQTGVNIGTNGAVAPRNIEISSMTFQSVPVTDIFFVETATQCYFDSVNFRGPLTQASITADLATDNIAGVRFSSTASLVCDQITFDKCRFTGLTYGINTDEEITGVTVSNSMFLTLYEGIVLGSGTVVNGGATGFRAVHNIFDVIYEEGIVYDDVSLNVSAYNVFYGVGNGFTANPQTAVITLGNDNNVSVSDMFERSDAANIVQPRVQILGGVTSTGSQIQLGRYARQSGRTFVLANNQTNQPIFESNATLVRAFSMDYTIQRDGEIRHGTLVVVSQPSDGSTVSQRFTDDFTETFDTGVTLGASQTGTTVTVLYSTTNTGFTGTLTFSLSNLA